MICIPVTNRISDGRAVFGYILLMTMVLVLVVYYLESVKYGLYSDVNHRHVTHQKKSIYIKDSSNLEMFQNILVPELAERKANLHTKHMKYTILLWNFPGWLTWRTDSTNMTLCSFNNCRLTYNKRMLNESNAVIFHVVHDLDDKPPVLPAQRDPNQVWVFYALESPIHILGQIWSPYWSNVFNWTFTFRPDADIFQPYGFLIPKLNTSKRNYSEIFRKKSKFAAWAVSNCETQSQREKYVDILRKYVDIDVFGDCNKNRIHGNKLPEIINNDYKFYISFENSLCETYVTEKFFRYYKMDVINIVRGENHYSGYFPDHSFIDTSNFSSIEELAQFMLELGADEKRYIDYLKIKDQYHVINVERTYGLGLCKMCDMLNNLDENKRTYENISDWYGTCVEPGDIIEKTVEHVT